MLHSQSNQWKSNLCFSMCILLLLALHVSIPFATTLYRPPLPSTQDGLELGELHSQPQAGGTFLQLWKDMGILQRQYPNKEASGKAPSLYSSQICV